MLINIQIYRPTNDYIFKKLIGQNESKDITESFIKNFLKLGDVEVKNISENKILNGDVKEDKIGILDILVETKNNKLINLEMQTGNYNSINNRLLFYISKIISREAIQKGKDYEDMLSTVLVLIVKDKIPKLKENKQYRTEWKMRERYTQTVLTDKAEIVILELGKMREMEKEGKAKLEPKVSLWLKFLLNPDEIGGEEMKNNKDIQRAKEEYDKIMEDDITWWRAFEEELREHDTETFINGAIRKAAKEAAREASKKATRKATKKAKKEGYKNRKERWNFINSKKNVEQWKRY